MSGAAARTVTIRLAVQDDDVRKKLEQLGQQGAVSLQQIEKAANDASPAMTRLGTVTDGVSRSMGGFASSLASPTAAITAMTTAAVGAGVAIAKVGDEMVSTQARLTAATGSAEAANRVMAELVKLGQQTGVSVSESAGAFARFSIAAREVGATNAQVIALVRTVQQAGIVAGASTQETTATVLQLGQALASGKLQGDELRSILENMPNLAEALARALNVSVGRLREMGTEGQLTADRVMPALLRAGEQINQQFERMPVTMGRAFDILGVSMTNFVGRLDQALGLSQAIARAAQAAAAAVGNATAAVTPLSAGDRAAADVTAAEGRRSRLETELARLSGESGYYSAPRQGTISRGLQGAAAGQTQSREEQIADLRQQIDTENRIIEQGLERRNAIARQESEAAEAEEATANARRNAAARQAATTAFNATRDDLDKERKLREDHRVAMDRIAQGVLAGAATEAEANRLRTMANRELEEGLKKLNETQGRNNEAQREANDLAREYNTLRRDTSGLLVANDTESRSIQEISRQIRGTALDPAQRRRDAEKLAEDTRKDAERVANSIETTFAGAFTRAFESGADAGKSFLESIEKGVKSLAATIASQLVFRMAVVPVVNAGAGALGYSGQLLGMPSTPIGGLTFGGLFGGASPVASTAGSTQAAMQQGQQSLSLYSAGRFGDLGSAFTTPGAYANTGFSAVDGALNYNLFTPTQSAGYQFVSSGLGQPAYTAANALGAAAGVGLGGLAIYNGVQRGGIGGAVGALGGALGVASGAVSAGVGTGLLSASGSLAALGPYGMIAAAVLAVVSALLPGQKPSGRGQETAIDLSTGAENWRGLTGDRYSAGNRESSEDAARQIANLAAQLGDALGGARLNTSAAVGVTNSQLYLRVNERRATFGNSEDGARDLAAEASRFLLEEFKSVVTEGDYAGILRASGTVEALQENLTFYEGVYKSFQTGATAANAFQESMDALNKSFGDIYGKAKDLALATDDIQKAWEKQQQDLIKQRDLNVQAYDMGLSVRALQATGGNTAPILEQIALMQFDVAAKQQIEQAKATLESLGLTTEDVAKKIALNEWVLGQERLKIQKDYGQQATDEAKRQAEEIAEAQKRAAQSVLDTLNQQSLGSLSSLSPAAKEQEAERQFRAALAGTDASAANSAFNAYLSASGDLYSTSSRAYAIREAGARQQLAQFGQAQRTTDPVTAAALERMRADIVAELRALLAETRDGNRDARLKVMPGT